VSFVVRDAVPDDVQAVAHVHVQGWRESYGPFLSAEALAGLSVEERARMWGKAVADPEPRAKFLVAERADGAIVGFVRGGPSRSQDSVPLGTEAEIYAIYILEKAKRQGLGRRLMQGVFRHLADSGFASAGLWVLTENLAACHFYEALGGRPGFRRTIDLPNQTVTEIAYRFEPIPR
jgi:ribosomal protein S18 acetylase RimI-like enzyme